MKNVLLIAPDMGLEKAMDEVRSVSIALNALPLIGKVTRGDVINTLNTRKWDIVWFATHGDDTGVLLTDGPLPTSDLTAIIRNTTAKLVVLNTCSSRHIGLELHEELGVDVICTQAPADDIKAYQTGTFLARNIASGMTTKQAFERSKPGNNTLYFLFEDRSQAARSEIDEGDVLIQLVRTEFNKVDRRIEDMGRKLSGQLVDLEDEVKKQIEELRKSYLDADKRLYAMEYVSNWDRLIVFGVFAATIVLFVIYVWNLMNR